MNEPIYTALVAEQKFDPAAVPPNQTRKERTALHTRWLVDADARVRAAVLTVPTKSRTRKAVAK